MSFDDRNPLQPRGRLTRDRVNGKFLGVCAGIGNYCDVDPTWVRLGFVLGTVLGFGSLIIVYFAVAVIAD
jgi:phage shock protein PspC (stress-responsive transcriptional regulator)